MLFHTKKLRISIYRRTTMQLGFILPVNVSLLPVNLCASFQTRGLCESSVPCNISPVFKKTNNEVNAVSFNSTFKFSEVYYSR